jgi:hypothetical protein
MPWLKAEAGSRPGGRGTCSLLRQRKVPKRKATPLPVSPSPVARGQPAMLGPGVTPKNSLRCEAAPVKQLRRARQRCACPSARAHPRPCASRHGQKGVGAGSTRAIASLGPRRHRCARHGQSDRAQHVGSAQRVTDTRRSCAAAAVFDPAPHPFWLRREAQELGWACVPKDTHASSSGSSLLFEQSSPEGGTARVQRRPHQIRASQVAPIARQGDGGRRLGAAFSLVTFSWRPRESYCAAGRTPRPPPSTNAHSNQHRKAVKHPTHPQEQKKARTKAGNLLAQGGGADHSRSTNKS